MILPHFFDIVGISILSFPCTFFILNILLFPHFFHIWKISIWILPHFFNIAVLSILSFPAFFWDFKNLNFTALSYLERIHLLCGKHFPPENSFQQFLWENIFHRFWWKNFSTIFGGKIVSRKKVWTTKIWAFQLIITMTILMHAYYHLSLMILPQHRFSTK